MQKQTYDLTPLSVEELMQFPGINVLARHLEYKATTAPDLVPEGLTHLMNNSTDNMYDTCISYVRSLAEQSEGARSKLNYGIQVSHTLGKKVETIGGTTIRGRTSRFDDRASRDLDLRLYFSSMPSEREVQDCFAVARDAEQKIGI